MLGYSIVKHVQGQGITKRIVNKKKFSVRQFSGSKVDCMKDYMKPCIKRERSGLLDISCGTNDVPSNKKAKCIAESIVCFPKKVKVSKLDGSISSIIPRNDNWNSKIMEVNSHLKDFCESNDIPFISNTHINSKKHLNNSRLHLNPKGSN